MVDLGRIAEGGIKMGSIVSFEVMVFKEGHWSIAFITDSKEEALSEAKTAEAGKHAQAVKVVQESTDEETGDERSRTIYSGGKHDVVPDHKNAKKLYERKAGLKNKSVDAPSGENKQELHPEKVTNFIDRIQLSVITIGLVGFMMFGLLLFYISNPETVSSWLDKFFT